MKVEDLQARNVRALRSLLTDTPYITHILIVFFLLFYPSLVSRLFGCIPLHVLYTLRFSYCKNQMTKHAPLTLCSYSFGKRMSRAAASPFSGSLGLGYRNSCGKNTSKMLIISIALA